jgi:flagellar motor switch protein FliN/FliY
MADEQSVPNPAAPEAASAEDVANAALNAAEQAVAKLNEPGDQPADGAEPFDLPAFADAAPGEAGSGMELLSDVNLNVKIELGRTRMLAGDPVDVYVNDRPVARGEVLVLNDNFCIRISEILTNPTDPA